MTTRPFACLVGLVLVAGAAGVSCVDAARIRQVTYPPSFHYITKAEIQGTMGELAGLIVELDALMARPEAMTPADEARVVAILGEMDRLAKQLKSGARSNHPRIDRAAPWLQRDIALALSHARAKPPSYYYAGTVSGACTYCHVPRVPTAPSPEPEPVYR